MEHWTPIRSDADIAELMEQYDYFLDSCLTQAHYDTGAYTAADGLVFAGLQEKELHLIFHSQCTDKALELCFTGVRQCLLPGWQDHYSSEISSCCLAIRTDLLLPRRDDPLIVWTNGPALQPKDTFEILHEPLPAFVIASDLKWRFVEK